MAQPGQKPCTTCGASWSADAFYAGCGECKDCKRNRSRQNRAVQARKLAIAERLIDALADLASRAVAS